MIKGTEFRGKSEYSKNWFYGHLMYKYGELSAYYVIGENISDPSPKIKTETIGQHIGLKDSKDKKIFESDYYWSKHDGDDHIYDTRVICVWVQEWCSFCWLNEDEYRSYESNGTKGLDDTEDYSCKLDECQYITISGNIHDKNLDTDTIREDLYCECVSYNGVDRSSRSATPTCKVCGNPIKK